jgi:hypothetical protein
MKKLLIATACAALLSACGPSQAQVLPLTATPVPTATPAGAPTQTPTVATSASFVITLNGGTGASILSAGRRTPKFVSPSTQSITFSVDGGVASTQNLAASATNCSTSNGGVRCSVPLTGLAAGSHSLVLSTFDGTNGGGNTLGGGLIAFTVVANQANVVSGVIGGVATGAALVPLNGAFAGSFSQGYTLAWNGHPVTVLAEALDADGNVIVGPGAPSIAMSSGNTSFSVTAASAANTSTISIANVTSGPSKAVLGQIFVAVTLAGGSTPALNFQTTLSVVEPTLYALLDTGKVVAFDENGDVLAHPNAADGINVVSNVAIAYAAPTTSLIGMTSTSIVTFNFSGENQSNTVALGAVTPQAAVFTWDPGSDTGFGFDTTSNKLFSVGPGVHSGSTTLLGAAQSNPYIALTSSEQSFGSSGDVLYAATLHTLGLVGLDGSTGSVFSQPPIGPISGLCYDPVHQFLFASGALGVGLISNSLLVPTSGFSGVPGPSAIACSPYNGFVYVAGAGDSAVHVFNENGVLQFTFSLPAGTAATQLVLAPAGV